MLRDLPRDGDEAHLFMNAPGHSANEIAIETPGPIDPLDDVFGSAPSSPVHGVNDHGGDVLAADIVAGPRPPLEPSDVPRLRSIHANNGYREGIAASKEQAIQLGFDEGYQLGAELGLRVGWLLGAVDGLLHALPAEARPSKPSIETDSDTPTRSDVENLLATAEQELQIESLFAESYFKVDELLLCDRRVPGQDEEQYKTVVTGIIDAHPLISQWTKKVCELARQLSVSLG